MYYTTKSNIGFHCKLSRLQQFLTSFIFYGFREFVCPVAPADGCFNPEVLERHRLRRNSKGAWEYRCPGREKAKKCWKAKEGVEWFIRRVLHESLNRKAVLCYLDFYDVSNSAF